MPRTDICSTSSCGRSPTGAPTGGVATRPGARRSRPRWSGRSFAGDPRNLAAWARHLTGRPSITVGSIGLSRDFLSSTELDALLTGVTGGDFDLVALGRVLLGNPSWARLAADGRLGEIHDYVKADEDVFF
jgi:2,4-dienoyl-CoA reductase-like NADH-dependent reductase (Old Yellow Enzyme family)